MHVYIQSYSHRCLDKKGPVVNIRGRHLQMLSSFYHVLTFTGDYLYSKPTPFSLFDSLSKQKDSHFNRTSLLVKKSQSNRGRFTYITMDPPAQCLVQAITCHRAHVSAHTLYLTFLLSCIVPSRQISCQQSNSWTTSDQTIVKCPCALTAFLNSWHIL